MSAELVYSVTDFVAICNQVLDVSFGSVHITGELSNFKMSKNRWVYFDLKDEYASLRFFGTVYQLPGPLEDGMVLTVSGVPTLHPKFGFSITVQSIQLSGEGTIKKAAHLLEQRLEKEGLFDQARKRNLPYPPKTIGVVSSAESAGYADFIKIANERWVGLTIKLFDVQVQGEKAPAQIVEAIQYFNRHTYDVDVLVVVRGGGSADDLQAFNHESVTRAVAASRIPTLVAIGHETDVSLAEKAADLRASTPSNAAQLLLPDKKTEAAQLLEGKQLLNQSARRIINEQLHSLHNLRDVVGRATEDIYQNTKRGLVFIKKNLELLSPETTLKRGYAIIRQGGHIVRGVEVLNQEQNITVQLYDGSVEAKLLKSGKL